MTTGSHWFTAFFVRLDDRFVNRVVRFWNVTIILHTKWPGEARYWERRSDAEIIARMSGGEIVETELCQLRGGGYL